MGMWVNEECEIILEEDFKNIAFLSQEAVASAESLIAHTIGRSHEIIDRAKSDAETTVKNSKEQGFSKGNDEGLQSGTMESISRALEEKQSLFDAISQLEARFSDVYVDKSGNNEYFDFAIELAQKIISIELAKNEDAFFGLYQKAALHIGNAEKSTLKAGPRGYAIANKQREKFMGAIDGLENFEIILEGKDDGLCILETPLGNIDASVNAQLGRAKQIISPQN
jgi:flagellar assembly protein FliH